MFFFHFSSISCLFTEIPYPLSEGRTWCVISEHFRPKTIFTTRKKEMRRKQQEWWPNNVYLNCDIRPQIYFVWILFSPGNNFSHDTRKREIKRQQSLPNKIHLNLGCITRGPPIRMCGPRHICSLSLTVSRFTWLIKPALRLLRLSFTLLHFLFQLLGFCNEWNSFFTVLRQPYGWFVASTSGYLARNMYGKVKCRPLE